MALALHMDKSAVDGIVSDPQGPAMSALGDVLARHAVTLVHEAGSVTKKGFSFNLHAIDGRTLTHDEESAIVDELMLADTQGFISGVTGTPQPKP